MGRGAAGSRELGGGERRGAGPGREALPARACRPRPRRPGPTLARRTARGRLRGDHAPSPVPRPRRRAHTLSPRATPLGHAPPHPPAPGPGRRADAPSGCKFPASGLDPGHLEGLAHVCLLSFLFLLVPALSPCGFWAPVCLPPPRGVSLSPSLRLPYFAPVNSAPCLSRVTPSPFSVPAALPPYSFPLLVP